MFLVSQLVIMILLVVAGEPLRKLISTYVKALRKLDIFQAITLDVYMGGFVFYVLALIPFSLFTRSYTFVMLASCLVLSLLLYIKKILYLVKKRNHDQRFLWTIRQVLAHETEILMGIILILIFLVVLWIEVEATVGVIFGNIHDASLFAMLVTVISEKGMIPQTLDPFEPSGIIYPQGLSVILTFATYVLNSKPSEVILTLTPLFQALVTFGAYFLGKMLLNRMSVGVIFAFMFAFVSRWPKLLLWGSYAFVAAFPLYFITMGLVPTIIDSFEWKKRGHVIELLFLGLVVGYLGAIHAVYYQVVIATLVVTSIGKLCRRQGSLFHKLLNPSLTFIFSLAPVSVFLYRFINFVSMPGHNVGLPSDVMEPRLFSLHENFGILFWGFLGSDWISPYPVLKVITIMLIALAFLIIAIARKSCWFNLLKGITKVTLSSLLGAVLVIIVASRELGMFFLATATNIPETAIVMFTLLVLLVSTSVVLVYDKIYSLLTVDLSKVISLIIVTALFIQSFSPFIYYTLTSDIEYAQGIYRLFAVTTHSDYELMIHMRNRLPNNSTVLINPYDAGGFIPAVSGYRVVYPFTGSRGSVSYSKLFSLILEGNLNRSTYNLMQQLNITHVFVGSKAVFTDGIRYLGLLAWDPMLFLGNPSFKLLERVGDTYLFAFNPKNTNVVLLDDFEHLNPQHNGWKLQAPPPGNGTFGVSISSERGYTFNGNNSLVLSTKAYPKSISVIRFYRIVYLPTPNGNVTLSLYLNSPTDFQDYEGLTIIISDENWKRQLFISTWDKEDAIRLLRAPGFYEIDLTPLWFTKFNASLPSRFFLQFEVLDSDSIESVFYVDYLSVSFRASVTGEWVS